MKEAGPSTEQQFTGHKFPEGILRQARELANRAGARPQEDERWQERRFEHLWREYALENFAGKAKITPTELRQSYEDVLQRMEQEQSGEGTKPIRAAGGYPQAEPGVDYRELGT